MRLNELRAELVEFAQWAFKGEHSEGHEEEIVDRYIKEEIEPYAI